VSPAAAGLSERERGAVATCRLILERLRQVLDEESAVLASRSLAAHGPFTERKNQLLRDLLVAQRNCASAQTLAALQPQTSALQQVLKRNQQLLRVHIDAVKEVSAIIVDSIRQADSDGTYSRFA
jgi:flagellar biosynthesis/type III secretory pathway chaperone